MAIITFVKQNQILDLSTITILIQSIKWLLWRKALCGFHVVMLPQHWSWYC